ncbi:TPA: restriction endonuclease [Klebsiella pneumoniae]|uniref:restriction endonuclease n=1 Tax=Klebsiella pneumoniae TaxID=573 RepID=UPI0019146C3E|nr:restriction endonuclease [Klebsiella pneumoniae]MBK5710239.1 restriction endonuclease [Klebsiella pneumoniae]HBQ5076463.1 restriction endonuclease [Klebsiella pneumoniae]HBW3255994.1 restriction endonuclease [Klebsiella pneumoniae]
MIDDPLPENWQDLQKGVQRIFRNVGLHADVEVDIETPRGSVNVDVHAIDVRSVDKITYIVECKNWGNSIPQTVVHSFTTVMHETGANIGFIISKYGLQQGAKQYTRNTNIIGMTYLEFQQRYFEAWWKRYFCPRIGDAADESLQYVEPINSMRDREYAKLSLQDQDKFDQLRQEKSVSVMAFSMLNFRFISKALNTSNLLDIPKDLHDFKTSVLAQICPHIEWYCDTYRELLELILEYLSDTKAEFDAIFGRAIFEPQSSITGVTADGSPLEDDIYYH